MAVVRHPVGEGRAVVEDELVVRRALPDRLAERVAGVQCSSTSRSSAGKSGWAVPRFPRFAGRRPSSCPRGAVLVREDDAPASVRAYRGTTSLAAGSGGRSQPASDGAGPARFKSGRKALSSGDSPVIAGSAPWTVSLAATAGIPAAHPAPSSQASIPASKVRAAAFGDALSALKNLAASISMRVATEYQGPLLTLVQRQLAKLV